MIYETTGGLVVSAVNAVISTNPLWVCVVDYGPLPLKVRMRYVCIYT